jgi:ABC-type bacteriocin/lantibiotic exporter with double-glycine peptidase domain
MLLVPISVFNKNAIGNLISKVNYDVEQISRALADSILELLSSIVCYRFFYRGNVSY